MSQDGPEPAGPLPIRKLQESLINKIAAGEVIQRPASALKELIENCLDAGATSIRVVAKEGGLKLLQIQDNGSGIRKADLPILAERFTTSKISTFSDLSKISTYGFRGEALASISHVSHLTVLTKTASEPCAWKAHYSDGTLSPSKPGLSAEPKPSAGNDGTVITIEDLFYNTPTRLSALKSSSDEYARILDVVTKYAIHNPTVAFSCKKIGSSGSEVSTPGNSRVPDAIRLLFGSTIAKELLTSKASSNAGSLSQPDTSDSQDSEAWSAEAHFTSPNHQAKKTTFLLFINHRLVESPRIKKSIESIYSAILPKGSYPFVYLSIQIDPRSIDVNVHPTKQTVHFLNEDVITEQIADSIQGTLNGRSASDKGNQAGNSRAFPVQVKQVILVSNLYYKRYDLDLDLTTALGPSTKKKVASQYKVRTSHHDRTLDSMFPVAHPSQITNTQKQSGTQAKGQPNTSKEIKETECYLASVIALRANILANRHIRLSDMLTHHVFVGIVDLNRGLSLMQHSTRLYLVNHIALAEELFYQLALRQFGNINRIRLSPSPPLSELVRIAVDAEDEERTQCTGLGKTDITKVVVDIVQSKSGLLQEYFHLGISEKGLVETLPLLLKGYTPNLDKLPDFLMRLGPEVTWTDEQQCFEGILRELAYFYTPSATPGATADPDSEQEKSERWQIEHVLFPAFRKYLVPTSSLLARDVVEIADLPELYKVFERC
ncbi:histidine kinase-like ATPase [Pterulicium gracile]|uniref:Histidine kinase-like ATPase n=1 Tax=Pterulicium gracile TaxID=1884261 RepID=A0A5C3R2W7_9AGAR|nr:histidine kinase-like ATPase [Pterula gracilis]